MKRCPLTYEEIIEEGRYSERGLRALSAKLTDLNDLPFDASEQLAEAARRAHRMSIQGVQPKLSAVLEPTRNEFRIVDQGGKFIIKVQHSAYSHLPENEDLTMRLAKLIGITVPLHGLIYAKSGSFVYFVKRFDRVGRNEKIQVEDFAQLMGRDRETKYDSSMEQVASLIEKHCTFPAVEKLELFRRVIFCCLIGNEDMHLKNFSLITDKRNVIHLTPAYDLLNTTLYHDSEELALPLHGKRRKITYSDYIEYFASERLALPEKQIKAVLAVCSGAQSAWSKLIEVSFLPKEMKEKYAMILAERRAKLGI